MNTSSLGSALAVLAGLVYLGIGASVYRSTRLESWAAGWMVWVSLVGLAGSAALVFEAVRSDPLIFFDFARSAESTIEYAWVLALLASLAPVMRVNAPKPRPVWLWAASGVLFIAVYLLLPLSKSGLFLLLALLALGLTSANLVSAWRRACHPKEYNVIYHLLLSWFLLLAGVVSCVVISPYIGQLLLVAGVSLTANVVKNQSLPFIQDNLRQWLTYLVVGLPAAAAAQIIYLLAAPLDQVSPGWGSALSGFLLAVLLIAVIHTLVRQAPRLVNSLIPVSTYDSNRIMREFSTGISAITNPELLATVSIGLISEAVDLKRGHLFEVNAEPGPNNPHFRFTSMGGMGKIDPQAANGILYISSPLVHALQVERQPLFMCDITASDSFTKMSEAERAWLASLKMQLFVPVHAKEDWIGLIVLDAKTTGAAYYPQDLNLICTLADQLSLALQNARLVDSLLRVNNDFRRAYTAMEQSNRQLQQAVFQLEKMDQTKSDFISVSSHELRTPLTVMRGYAEMLLDDPSLKSQTGQTKMVRGIHASIMRLHEIVDSMLDIASIDARSLELHKHPISIYHIITSVCGSLKSTFDERKIQLTLENLRDLPTVDVDPDLMTKVFYQLVTNAIKYTPDNGAITISGVVVSAGQMGFLQGAVEIVLADTGIGIDPSNLELIFRKFFQTGQVALHSSGKTKFKGSGPGLGLAIAKGIVDAHNGKIWAESKGLNEQSFPGSQFHVVLPQSGLPEEEEEE